MFKKCTTCKKFLSLEQYHVLKKGKFGRNSSCKVCRKIKYKRDNIENINLNKIICTKCNILKSTNNFYKNNRSLNGYQNICKICQKNNIAISMSKLENYTKCILKKFKKKNKRLEIKITYKDLIDLFRQQNNRCFITNHKMTTYVDINQRTDNVWNMAIYIIDNEEEINKKNVKLVIHLVYTLQNLYNLNMVDITKTYRELANNII